MMVQTIKSLWGMDGSLEEQFQRIRDAGYDGIESKVPLPAEKYLFQQLLNKYNLSYVAMITAKDIEKFKNELRKAIELNPVLVTSHSCRDSDDYEQQRNFFKQAVEIEKFYGTPVAHETHRRYALYTPWTTRQLLHDVTDIKIAADFSHWCCVCESLLESYADELQLAISRTIHIHGRVGFSQGPQVSDPRAPEFKNELDVHMKWWIDIYEHRRRSGANVLTFTPEYGPVPYMPTLPYENVPVADLWEICSWASTHFKASILLS